MSIRNKHVTAGTAIDSPEYCPIKSGKCDLSSCSISVSSDFSELILNLEDNWVTPTSITLEFSLTEDKNDGSKTQSVTILVSTVDCTVSPNKPTFDSSETQITMGALNTNVAYFSFILACTSYSPKYEDCRPF